jgi:hypothetical protein
MLALATAIGAKQLVQQLVKSSFFFSSAKVSCVLLFKQQHSCSNETAAPWQSCTG